MPRPDRLGISEDVDDVPIDMSPMIDLVFLLLIFFMTSSTLITFLKDHRVTLPVAESARVPRHLATRFVINVYPDGGYGDERGKPVLEEDLADHIQRELKRRPGRRLQIRADRRTAHAAVKRVLRVARAQGLDQVIFSAYTTDL